MLVIKKVTSFDCTILPVNLNSSLGLRMACRLLPHYISAADAKVFAQAE